MKKLIQPFLVLSFLATVFTACEKDQTLAVFDPANTKASTFSASKNSLVLLKADQANNAITFNYSKADFGFESGAKYYLQFAKKGTDFANAQEVLLDPAATSKAFTVLDFNALMLKLNLPFDNATAVQSRVKATLSPSVTPTYSTIVELSVKPYPLIEYLYVPGDYQGWNPSTADSIMSPTGNGIYSGVINFTNSTTLAFLLNPKKNWDNKYADGGPGKLSYNSGGDLKAPSNYPYKITANTNNLTITMEKHSWGVIGDATPTGWGADTDLKYNNGTQKWTVDIALTGGKAIKFRLNDDWSVNFGSKTAGVLDTENDNNIAIATSGNYRITADFVAKTYSLVKL